MRGPKDEIASYKIFKVPELSVPKDRRNHGTELEGGHWVEPQGLHVALISTVCNREDDPCKCSMGSPKASGARCWDLRRNSAFLKF